MSQAQSMLNMFGQMANIYGPGGANKLAQDLLPMLSQGCDKDAAELTNVALQMFKGEDNAKTRKMREILGLGVSNMAKIFNDQGTGASQELRNHLADSRISHMAQDIRDMMTEEILGKKQDKYILCEHVKALDKRYREGFEGFTFKHIAVCLRYAQLVKGSQPRYVFCVGSGDGWAELKFKNLGVERIVTIDPDPMSYAPTKSEETTGDGIAPMFATIQQAIEAYPDAVGNCVIWVGWPSPGKSAYEIEAFSVANPTSIVMVYGNIGNAGGNDLHAWLWKQGLPNKNTAYMKNCVCECASGYKTLQDAEHGVSKYKLGEYKTLYRWSRVRSSGAPAQNSLVWLVRKGSSLRADHRSNRLLQETPLMDPFQLSKDCAYCVKYMGVSSSLSLSTSH